MRIGLAISSAATRPKQIPMPEALAMLKPLLEDPSVLKIGHDIKVDIAVMTKHGIALGPIDDAMLISYALEGGAHSQDLDELSTINLEHTLIARGDVTGTGKSAVTFDTVALEKALPYAAEKADVALRLHQLLKPRLAQERLLTLYETIERPLVPVVAAMEVAGIKVDARTLQALSADFAGRIAQIEREIQDIAGVRAQSRLAQAAGRGAVRQAEVARRQEGQDGRLRHRRRHPGGAGADLRPPAAAEDPGLAPARPSSRAPTPTRCRTRSTRPPAASTPPTRWR